jgi:glycosyltransferase involved in cell wall biosynthesis
MYTIADSRLVGPGELEEFCALDESFMTKLTMKYNPLYYRRMADAIARQYGPQLVHITSSSIGLMPFIARLRQQNIEVVYTIHDPDPHERKKRLWDVLVERYHYALQMPWILSNCSASHVHTKGQVTAIRGKYGDRRADKLYVVQHGGGATIAVLSGTGMPKELQDESDLFTFLFFGRIEPYKGLSILLSAFEKLVAIYPSCRLVIAGAGVIREDIRLPSGQCVLINRFIGDSEIRWILERASVVVLPYVSATQSGVIPLAYEFSRTVICSDIGGLPEMVVVGRTGLIVPPGDVDALVNAMRSLAEDREATRKMGANARAHMTEHFSWQTVAQQHRAKYEALLAEKETQRSKAWVTQHNAD